MQAVAGDAARWGSQEHLLAALIDSVNVSNYLFARVHFKGNPNRPKPIRRPGEEIVGRLGGKRTYTREEMRDMLDHWGEGAIDTLEIKEVT